MKKPKLSLGSGGLKGLFVQHVEKIVFGIALFLVVAFVFLGYRLDSNLGDKTPDKLQNLATNAVSNIEQQSAENLRKDRVPREGRGGQYFTRVDQDDPPDPQSYAIKPWAPPMARPGSKREDPAVFAPVKLETTALVGPLCIRAEGGEKSLLADLRTRPHPRRRSDSRSSRGKRAGAVPVAAEAAAAVATPMPAKAINRVACSAAWAAVGRTAAADSSAVATLTRAAVAIPAPDARKRAMGPAVPNVPIRKTKSVGIVPWARRFPASGGMGAMGGAGGSMMPGSGGGLMPVVGLAGSGGGLMPGSGGGTRPAADDDDESGMAAGQPLSQSAAVIAVKALVPYRKQADEYKRVLGEAIGFDPLRDTPRIIFFQAQRADVTDDPAKELQEADWQLVMTPKMAETNAVDGRWHGVMQEIADMMYVDSNVTMPAPPMMLRCMESAMLHSEVPRSKIVPTMEKPAGDERKEERRYEKRRQGWFGSAGRQSAGRWFPERWCTERLSRCRWQHDAGCRQHDARFRWQHDAGRGQHDAGRGSMMPGSGGSMMPGAGSMMPGAGGSMMPGSGGGMMPGSGGSMMPGMGGMMPGAGGYPGSYSGTVEVAQYKLIRFFDMNVEPGKVYRYRVRVFLEDPNNPNTDPRMGSSSCRRPDVRCR